jgi:hypothetical protein
MAKPATRPAPPVVVPDDARSAAAYAAYVASRGDRNAYTRYALARAAAGAS